MNKLVLACIFIVSSVVDGWTWLTDHMEDPDAETGGTFFGTAPFCDGKCDSTDSYSWIQGLTAGDGHKCSTGSKMYCNNYGSPYASQAWSGSAPFCNGKCAEGESCIVNDFYGDGSHCTSGTKYLNVIYSSSSVSSLEDYGFLPQVEMGFVFKILLNDDDDISETKTNNLTDTFIDNFITVMSDAYGNLWDIDSSSLLTNGFLNGSNNTNSTENDIDYGFYDYVFDYNDTDGVYALFGINMKVSFDTMEEAENFENYFDNDTNIEQFNVELNDYLDTVLFSFYDLFYGTTDDAPIQNYYIFFIEANLVLNDTYNYGVNTTIAMDSDESYTISTFGIFSFVAMLCMF